MSATRPSFIGSTPFAITPILVMAKGHNKTGFPAWFKSWVFQVTVRTVPVPQPGTLAVGSGASDEPVQADAGTRRPGPEARPSRSRRADIAGRRLAGQTEDVMAKPFQQQGDVDAQRDRRVRRGTG